MKLTKYKYIGNIPVGESFKHKGEYYTRIGLAYLTSREEDVTLAPPFQDHIIAQEYSSGCLVLIDGSLTTPS